MPPSVSARELPAKRSVDKKLVAMKVDDRAKMAAINGGYMPGKKVKKKLPGNNGVISKTRATSTSSREERKRSVSSFERHNSSQDYQQPPQKMI